MPCVGYNAQRLIALIQHFPHCTFSSIADHPDTLMQLRTAALHSPTPLRVYLELDCGMGRTGIVVGDAAFALAQSIAQSPELSFAGLHAYDGHIHASTMEERESLCAAAFEPVEAFRQRLLASGLAVPEFVAGGSPTFGIHARQPHRTLSPGTTVLWDFGYGDRFPDLPFQHAAVLLTRVISKPSSDRITVDLGHKSVAPENPHPRVRFFEAPDADFVMQSEEHLVLRVPNAEAFAIGQSLHGIPRHICPSVSMHSEAYWIARDQRAERITITSRSRRITI
jgi:D-serine deaminase-like pyridoxal phosphate-dependent protein